MTAKDEALAALAAHKAAIDQVKQHVADLEAQTVEFVVPCRQAGVTWQSIADTLKRQKTHVSAQYSPFIEEIRTVRVKPADSKGATDGS